MGVPRAVLFGIYITAPDCWKLPNGFSLWFVSAWHLHVSADPCRGGAQKLRSCMLTAQHYAAVAVFADSYRPSVASPYLL